MHSWRKLAPALAAMAVLSGCGLPAAPQPPSLELPEPVRDLRAARRGDKVTLVWTAPQLTTDKQQVRNPGSTRVCRSVEPAQASAAAECGQIVAELPAANTVTAPIQLVDTIPSQLSEQQPLAAAVYRVEVLNQRGRSAGLSNAARVPLAPTLPPPTKLFAQVSANGPVISWLVPPDDRRQQLLMPESLKAQAPLSYGYRLYRREKDRRDAAAVIVPLDSAFPSPVLPQPSLGVRDPTAEWEKTYLYTVAVVTTVRRDGSTVEVEGELSPPAEVLVHDVFPPAAPTGVEAVFTATPAERFIDLTWIPSTDADLAGYNVYRREANSAPVKINRDLLKAPAFRDANMAPGNTYLYSVSAVDLRGNESRRSAEASEKVPE